MPDVLAPILFLPPFQPPILMAGWGGPSLPPPRDTRGGSIQDFNLGAGREPNALELRRRMGVGYGEGSVKGAADPSSKGECPSPDFFLILGSRDAYFGAFSDPPESDSVVPAIGRLYGIFGDRAISNRPIL